MNNSDPMKKTKDEYHDIIDKIGSQNAVGIDPQLTHSIIIDYLQQLNRRLENVEKIISQKSGK